MLRPSASCGSVGDLDTDYLRYRLSIVAISLAGTAKAVVFASVGACWSRGGSYFACAMVRGSLAVPVPVVE